MLWWRTAWRLSFLFQISPMYTPPSLATDCYVREIYILPRFSCPLPCIEPHSVVSYAFRELWVDNSSFRSQSPCLKPPPTESSGKDAGTARLHSLSCAVDKEQFLEKWRGPGSLEITKEKKPCLSLCLMELYSNFIGWIWFSLIRLTVWRDLEQNR